MKNFIKNNGLSIVFFLLFVISIIGQVYFGFLEYNKDRVEEGVAAIDLFSYFSSGHFIQSTFENWESEFLQMALFVVFTIFLQQKGSSESKDFDKEEETDREPDPKGGLILRFYKYSLTIVLTILFLFSFGIHFYGSLKDENEQLAIKGLPLENAEKYITDSRFWFESFQNWQSEFLSVLAIVLLSIWLRQKGSPQSKPVDAPFDETGS